MSAMRRRGLLIAASLVLPLALGGVVSARMSWLPREVQAHRGPVRAIAFAPNGRTLTSIGWDASLRVLSDRAEPVRSLRLGGWKFDGSYRPVERAVFSRDGATFAVTGSCYFSLNRISDGALRRSWVHSNKDDVTALALSPRGDVVALNSARSERGQLAWWSVKGPRKPSPDVSALEVDDVVWSAAFSPDGTRFAAEGTRLIMVWDVRSRQMLWKRQVEDAKADASTAMTFSPSGKRLVVAFSTGHVYMCDAATGRVVHRLPPRGAGSLVAAFSPDDITLAVGEPNGTVTLWNGRDGMQQRAIKRPHGAVTALVWSPDGTKLASGYQDGVVAIWRAR